MSNGIGVAVIVVLALSAGGLCIAFVRARSRYKNAESRLSTRSDQFNVLAHEFKTPLALITATTEILLGGAPGELTGDQQAFLKEIENSTSRLGLLADNILTESKLEAGVFSPTMAPTDIRALTAEVWRSMRRLAEQRGQHVELDYPRRMDLVTGDESLLRQAITNLVQNAIRHTTEGGTISIRVLENSAEVVISVWDDGAGMSPDDRKRSFQEFVSHSGGTGLGLTIVETIANLHGGHVKVDTSLGKGAAFFFTLPRSGHV